MNEEEKRTKVVVDLFKDSGKFYFQQTYMSSFAVWDIQAIKKEVLENFKNISSEKKFTIEVSDGKGAWNKYLFTNND